MKNVWKTVRIAALGLMCLAALYGYANAEGNLLGDGRDYYLAPDQLQYGGIYSEGVTVDGGGIQCVAEDESSLPRLYVSSVPGYISGAYARNAASEMFVSPSLSSGVMTLDFLCIDEGASIDVRFWENSGELGFLNTQNPAVVISQREETDGSIVTCVTRSCLTDRTLVGDSTIYRSASGIMRLTGNYKSVKAVPAFEADIIGSAQWTYETDTRKLTASALNADGEYTNISYYAFVENIILMSGRNTAKASGVVKSESDEDEWRLRIVFPDAGVFQSPVYKMTGEIACLCDATSFLTPSQTEKNEEDKAKPEPTAPPETAKTPAPTATPAPISVLTRLPLPDSENPREIDSDTTVGFSKTGAPDISVTVDRLSFTVEVGGIPAGQTLSRINFTQVFSDGGFHMNMLNAYASPSSFSAENGTGKVTLTVYLADSSGNETAYPAGTFLITGK